MLTEDAARHFIETLLPAEAQSLRRARMQPDDLGLPHHEMFPSQLAFLQCFIAASGIRRVLELGTFLGYSTIAMAQTLDKAGGGQLVTVDIDPGSLKEARLNVANATLATDVEFMQADAATACDILKGANRTFDMILLDVNESEYIRLYSPCVDLLRPRGTLVIDNVLMSTVAGWQSDENVVHGNSTDIVALRDLLKLATTDKRVLSSILPFGSGIALCVRTDHTV